MKTLFALLALALAATVSSALTSDDLDNLDVAGLLADPEKEKKFEECILTDQCTDLARQLREILENAMETKCESCTEIQKGKIRNALKYFMANRNEFWQKFVAKYDPKGERNEELKKFLEEKN